MPVKRLQPFFKIFELLPFYKGHTGTYAFLITSGIVKCNGADAVIEQICNKLIACHAGIAHCKIKTVGDWFVNVFFIHQLKSIVEEQTLHDVCLLAILLYICNKIIMPFVC